MKVKIGGQIMKEFVKLRTKTHSYSKDNNDEDKKSKKHKKCIIKRKLKFEDYKNCLEEPQIENKLNQLEQTKIYVGSLKELTKNNKLILKNRQRFKIEGTMFLLNKLKRLL